MALLTLYLPYIPEGKTRGRTNSGDVLNCIGNKPHAGYRSPKHQTYHDVSPILSHVANPDFPFERLTIRDRKGKYRWETDYKAKTKADHEQYLSQLFCLETLNQKKNCFPDSCRDIHQKTQKMLKNAMERGLYFV